MHKTHTLLITVFVLLLSLTCPAQDLSDGPYIQIENDSASITWIENSSAHHQRMDTVAAKRWLHRKYPRLFSSLIIGLILKQVGIYTNWDLLADFGQFAQYMMGPAIGAGVAYSVHASPLGVFASVITGALGAGTKSPSGVSSPRHRPPGSVLFCRRA